MLALASPFLIPSNKTHTPRLNLRKKKSSQKHSKPGKTDEQIGNHEDLAENGNVFSDSKVKSKESKKKEGLGSNFDGEGKEWSEAEIEISKKQRVKNPVGKPGRWEKKKKKKKDEDVCSG